MKPMDLGKTEQGYVLFLYLFLLHFFNGIVFDFFSTIYAFYLIHTPLQYPSWSTLSSTIWGLITCLIFLKILQLYDYKKMNAWILTLYFIFIYTSGMHIVGNSVQIKLWLIGYQDNLGHGIPSAKNLSDIPMAIMPIFKLLYFYDEYLGHFLLFAGYFAFFLLFYFSGFTSEKIIFKKHTALFYTSALLNGLYIAWNIIEGQSILIFSFFSLIMLGIYVYQHKLQHYYIDNFGKQIQAIIIMAWIDIFLWFATLGHFHALPQFFETMVSLLGIQI